MKIHVTEEDISEGVKQSSRSCPIARAICRVYSEESRRNRRFSVADIYVLVNNTSKVFLPATAITFIARFDRGMDVQPFDFELNYGTSEEN
jgi:hypothetical protein